MTDTNPAITAARNAERDLWHEYGLTVVERFIEIDIPRLRVRMLECGNPSGEPLIFVQGELGEALGWASLLARLTDFQCITLDRPGGGLSDGVDFLEVDARRLAVDVLEAVLDAAGVRQAAFVANSMGGWWTFQLAMAAPARVSRMVMLGCPAVILNTSAPFPRTVIGRKHWKAHGNWSSSIWASSPTPCRPAASVPTCSMGFAAFSPGRPAKSRSDRPCGWFQMRWCKCSPPQERPMNVAPRCRSTSSAAAPALSSIPWVKMSD